MEPSTGSASKYGKFRPQVTGAQRQVLELIKTITPPATTGADPSSSAMRDPSAGRRSPASSGSGSSPGGKLAGSTDGADEIWSRILTLLSQFAVPRTKSVGAGGTGGGGGGMAGGGRYGVDRTVSPKFSGLAADTLVSLIVDPLSNEADPSAAPSTSTSASGSSGGPRLSIDTASVVPVAARAIAFRRLMTDLAPATTNMAPVGVVVASAPHAVLWVRNVLTSGIVCESVVPAAALAKVIDTLINVTASGLDAVERTSSGPTPTSKGRRDADRETDGDAALGGVATAWAAAVAAGGRLLVPWTVSMGDGESDGEGEGGSAGTVAAPEPLSASIATDSVEPRLRLLALICSPQLPSHASPGAVQMQMLDARARARTRRPPKVAAALLQALRATVVSACLSALLLAESTGEEIDDTERGNGGGDGDSDGGSGGGGDGGDGGGGVTTIANRCGWYRHWLSTNGEMRVACAAADALVGLVVDEEERREEAAAAGDVDGDGDGDGEHGDGAFGGGGGSGGGGSNGGGGSSALAELLAWSRTVLLLYMAAEGLVMDPSVEAADHHTPSPNVASSSEVAVPKPNRSASMALEAQVTPPSLRSHSLLIACLAPFLAPFLSLSLSLLPSLPLSL